MRRGVVIGVAAGAVLLLAAGAIAFQQWSRGRDLETRIDRLRAQLAEERSALGRSSDEAAQLRVRLQAAHKKRQKAEEGWAEQASCVSRLSAEPAAGEQTVTFGFIRGFDNGGGAVLFDPAQWFVGDDANRAAAADGEIEPGEPVPNDYYIRNREGATLAKRLDENTVVVLTTADRHNIPSPRCLTTRGFRRAFTQPRDWERSIRDSPYWMVERDGVVIRLVEQYVP